MKKVLLRETEHRIRVSEATDEEAYGREKYFA